MAMLRKTVWGKTIWGNALFCVLLLVTAAPLWAQARLPESLRKHVASKSAQTVDVIVHGSPDEVNARWRRATGCASKSACRRRRAAGQRRADCRR